MKRDSQKGTILIIGVILLPVFLAFACLSIDSWNLFLVRNQMQKAVDAAALAAVTSVYKVSPGDTAEAVSNGLKIAELNNFINGTNQISVTVSIPPGDPYGKSPTYANDKNYARVQITQNAPLFFGAFIGISSATVQANAVAGPSSIVSTIVTLSTSGSGAYRMTGSSTVNTSGGSISVNSNSSTALTINGSSSITANSVNIVGGYSGAGTINATINTKASAVTDPFASLVMPTPSTCTYTGFSISGSKSHTLNPGTYCGGISISSSPTVKFNPGVYILNGGGLNISGSAKISGDGIVFYNTGTSSGSTSYGSISISGSGEIKFTAPTSGTYSGMLFIQNPLNTRSASIAMSSNSYYAGNVYLPNASLTISGSGTASKPNGVTVVKTLTLSGSNRLTFSNSYGGGSSSTGQISLYE